MPMPLEGIRVVDLTRVLAGPFCTRQLGDLGAEVIKIEGVNQGDPTRYFAGTKIRDATGYFVITNRNKKSITLNLRDERGRQVFYDLVKVSDIVVDNYRGGMTKRMKVDYDTLKQLNPKIICCSISGFGQEGPYAQRPAYDHLAQALSGLMSIIGPEDGKVPCITGIPAGDCLGGTYATLAILAALMHRERYGEGGFIDIALTDNLVDLLTLMAQSYFIDGSIPGPVGSGHPTNVHRAFNCKDDRWIQISVPSQDMWERLCKVLEKNPGYESIASDSRFDTVHKRLTNRPILWPYLDKLFATKTRDEWVKEMLEGDVPHAPILNVAEALNDPQLLSRKMVVEVDQPNWGKYKTLGTPFKMTQIEQERYEPPPQLGEHTEEVLGGLLGCSSEKIEQLRTDGVI
ncbi:CaiB/BaiF CoA transferase family protein [Chloroflexota bacterium]